MNLARARKRWRAYWVYQGYRADKALDLAARASQVRRLELGPGDVIVVNLADPSPSVDLVERTYEVAHSLFPGHKVVVLPNGNEITIIRPEPHDCGAAQRELLEIAAALQKGPS